MTLRADYQIVIIDRLTGTTLDIIPYPTWQHVRYSRVLNGLGQFTMTLPASYSRVLEYYNLFDTLIEVYRRNSNTLEKEETYLLRHFNVYADDNGNDWITIGGVSLNDFLRRRVLVLLDDPNSAGGYLTYQDTCSTVMADLVYYQLIAPQTNADRAISSLSLGTVTGGNIVATRKQFGVNLLELLQEIEVDGDCDFEIVRTTLNSFEFNAAVIGTDRTVTTNYPGGASVIFAPQRRNIITPSFIFNRTEEYNAVWVQGQGPDENRARLLVENATDQADTPWNYCESVTDSRDSDSTDALTTAGEAFLQENRGTQTFDFTPDLRVVGSQYNEDWFFGDKVTGIYFENQKDVRIATVDITLDGDGEQIDITLENII